jgi:hypothetical protein
LSRRRRATRNDGGAKSEALSDQLTYTGLLLGVRPRLTPPLCCRYRLASSLYGRLGGRASPWVSRVEWRHRIRHRPRCHLTRACTPAPHRRPVARALKVPMMMISVPPGDVRLSGWGTCFSSRGPFSTNTHLVLLPPHPHMHSFSVLSCPLKTQRVLSNSKTRHTSHHCPFKTQRVLSNSKTRATPATTPPPNPSSHRNPIPRPGRPSS